MAVVSNWYSQAIHGAFGKFIDIDTDVLKAALVKPAYVFNQHTHDFLNDITANEVSGGGYARVTIGAVTHAQASGIWAATFPATIAFGTLTLTTAGTGASGMVVYDETSGATDATRYLLFYVNFGAEQLPNGQTLTVTMPSGNQPVKVTVATAV